MIWLLQRQLAERNSGFCSLIRGEIEHKSALPFRQRTMQGTEGVVCDLEGGKDIKEVDFGKGERGKRPVTNLYPHLLL